MSDALKVVIGDGAASVGALVVVCAWIWWRMARIERKLDKHNGFNDRLIKIETICPVLNGKPVPEAK